MAASTHLRRKPTPLAAEPEVATPVETPPPAPHEPAPRVEPQTPTGLGALSELAGLEGFDMGALLAQNPMRTDLPKPGEAVTGKVLRLGEPDVLIDLAGRTEGWIARREIPQAQVGDTLEAWVLSVDETGIRLSRVLSGPASAGLLEEALHAHIPVEALVERRQANAGFAVKIGVVRAFLPMSHASRLPLADPDQLVGLTLPVLVLETGERTIVSRRELEERELDGDPTQRLAALQVGTTHTATVLTVLGWGAYIDINGVEARLPKHEVSWQDVSDLSTVLERGQRIQVRILEIDGDKRILASMRDPAFDPWTQAAQTLSAGQSFTGRVASLTDFGVFVKLPAGIDGLIHKSRLRGRPLKAGQDVEVRIRAIDPHARRLDLGFSDEDPEDPDESASVREALRAQPSAHMGTLGDLLREKLNNR